MEDELLTSVKELEGFSAELKEAKKFNRPSRSLMRRGVSLIFKTVDKLVGAINKDDPSILRDILPDIPVHYVICEMTEDELLKYRAALREKHGYNERELLKQMFEEEARTEEN